MAPKPGSSQKPQEINDDDDDGTVSEYWIDAQGNALVGVDHYDLLGIDPSAEPRLTHAQLLQRARLVASVLQPPRSGQAAQPVPYTLVQANALRDWLNQSHAADFEGGRRQGGRASRPPKAHTEQQLVAQFYRRYECRRDFVFQSTWNPAAMRSDGASGRAHIADPAIMVPVGGHHAGTDSKRVSIAHGAARTATEETGSPSHPSPSGGAGSSPAGASAIWVWSPRKGRLVQRDTGPAIEILSDGEGDDKE